MPEFRRLRWLFVLISLFLVQLSAIGQNKKMFVVTGKIVPEVATSANGAIEMSKSGATAIKIDIPRNGRFRLELEYFNEFTLVFSLPGHFNKTILISTEIPQEVWDRDNDFPPFPMIVQLFKEIEGIDKSFTLKPSGRIFYGKQTDNFEKESIFNDIEIAEQINNATALTGQVKKEAQGIDKQETQDLAAKEKNFEQAVNEADVLYRRGEFQPALLKYKEANQLFPEKVYPNDRIAELQDLVKAMEITQQQKAEVEQKYQGAIAQANRFFDQQTYLQARPSYEEALQYKPGDPYANRRIGEIDQLLALQAKQKQFDEIVAQADNHFNSKQLDQAAALYTQAKLIIPENEYPQNQLNLINEEKQKLIQLAELETEFSLTIDNGDNFASQKDYQQALNAYRRALELKPNNQLATNKISSTEQQIAILKKGQQAKALEEQYKSVIARADKSFDAQNYTDARSIYSEALAIKSSESHPTQRIARIDEIIAENERLKQLDNEFLALVGKGNAALAQKDYEVARGDYSSALGIKPNSAEVKNKIKNIDTILQKLAADQKKEEDQLLALAAANNKAYTDAMTRGNQQMEQKTYAKARLTFLEARQLKPDEQLPNEMIARIDSLTTAHERTLAEARLKEEAYQKSILETQDQSFLEAMNTADKAFSENDFTTAKRAYQTALTIKKDDPDAKKKLGQTDTKIAELSQLTLVFNAAINMANKHVEDKLYLEAREKYQEALQYFPESDYPKHQIERLDELLAQVEVERQKEEMYTVKIKEGQTSLGNKDFMVARSAFVKASEIKPTEALPLQRIGEIDKILSDLALAKAKNQTVESAYQEAIARADQKSDAKEYLAAQLIYGEALAIKPNEQYPKNRVAEIEKLLADLKTQQNNQAAKQKALLEAQQEITNSRELGTRQQAKNDSIMGLKAIAAAPVEIAPALSAEENIQASPINRSAQSFETVPSTRDYDEVIRQADDAFGIKDYAVARFYYYKASESKPAEKYPRNQIDLIRKLVDSELSSVDRSGYQEAIDKADDAFKKNNYTVAKFYFNKALGIKSWEKYPKDRIQEILDLTNSLLSEKEEQEYRDLIAKGDEAFTLKEIAIARFYYNKAISMKRDEDYPRIKLKDIEKIIDQDGLDLRNLEYNTIIELADQALQDENYSIARFNYNKALGMRPNEKYPKDQLKRIKEALDK